MANAVAERLIEVYEEDGIVGVFDWVAVHHPDWEWEFCDACDDETPTWEGSCAVCFTAR